MKKKQNRPTVAPPTKNQPPTANSQPLSIVNRDKIQWTVKELYEAYRDHIKHEDSLRSERLKALFTLQTILFAALGAFAKENSGRLTPLLILLGFISAIAYGIELYLGDKALGNIQRRWWDNLNTYFGNTPTPPIIGYNSPWFTEIFLRLILPTRLVPLLFIIGWVWVMMSYYRSDLLPPWLQLPNHRGLEI